MQLQLIRSEQQTMSSHEIAEIVNARHDNVLRMCRRLLGKGLLSGEERLNIHTGYPEFNLSFRDTMVVVSGYSVELRAKIIDRWQELEAKLPNDPVPQSIATSQVIVALAEKAKQFASLKKEMEIAEQAAQEILASLGVAAPVKPKRTPMLSHDEIVKKLVSKNAASGYSGVYPHRLSKGEWMVRFERDKVVYYGGAGMSQNEAIEKRIAMEKMLRAGEDMSDFIVNH